MEEVSCLLLEGGLVPMELNPGRNHYRDVPDGLVHVCSGAPSRRSATNDPRNISKIRLSHQSASFPPHYSLSRFDHQAGRRRKGREGLQLSKTRLKVTRSTSKRLSLKRAVSLTSDPTRHRSAPGGQRGRRDAPPPALLPFPQ